MTNPTADETRLSAGDIEGNKNNLLLLAERLAAENEPYRASLLRRAAHVLDQLTAALARAEAAEARVAELETKTAVALRVGDGLFVYGDDESTKVCQDKLFRMEAAEKAMEPFLDLMRMGDPGWADDEQVTIRVYLRDLRRAAVAALRQDGQTGGK